MSTGTALSSNRPAVALAALLGGMGVLHFVAPKPFDSIVPKALPGKPRTWTYLSGVAELGCAVAVAAPKTRRLGALASAGLFLAVFPANIKMAADYRDKPLAQRLAVYARLPLQLPLVAWALRVRRSAM
ncbi:putative membrane protein [Kutzneria albida DSM 43870]|uniref:Putative membrane protein n=1 Tax=Kutzneria albida DSM 43870 TaxID=1449976 RepID=W5VZP9_9PSEU|nr:putative membrane protein [Kutzneria albida DSM 43870]